MSTQSLEQTLRVVLASVHKDRPVAYGIYERLRRETFLDIWFVQDEHNQPGVEPDTQTLLAACDMLLICLTPASFVDNQLHHSLQSLLDTIHKQHPGTTPGFILRLTPCDIPPEYAHWPVLDVFEANGYYRLMRTLRKRASEVVLVGQTLGFYTIESLLGQGRLGKVYRGYRSDNPKDSGAITVLHEWVTAAPDFAQRFQRYVTHIVPLQQSHILPIREAAYYERIRQWYIVTDFVTYGTLDAVLKKRTSDLLRLHIGLELARQIAVALSHIHTRGIVHGSITPCCIYVARKDRPASGRSDYGAIVGDIGLIDLIGTSYATTESNLPHVYATLSPEQCRGEPPRVASDIYALGCILSLLTTGQMPFDTHTLLEATYHHINVEPALPSVRNPALPADVEEIILRCLAKEPEHRYPMAADVAQALEQALKHPALATIAPVPETPCTTTSPAPVSPIRLVADSATRQLVPGKAASIPLRLSNHGTRLRSMTLTIDGVPDTWTRTIESEIVLKPIDTTAIVCSLMPPATLKQTQRTGVITFRAHSDDQQTAETQTEWHVQLLSGTLVRKALPIVVGVLLASWLLGTVLTGSFFAAGIADTPAAVSVTHTATSPAVSTPTPRPLRTAPALLPTAHVSITETYPLTRTVRLSNPWGRTIEWERQ